MLQGSGFGARAMKTTPAPGGSALASKGYTAGLSPGDFTLGCQWLLEGNGPARPLKSAWKQGEESPASPVPASSRLIPRGKGISGLRPELLKAPWVTALLCCRRRWRFQALPGTNAQSDRNPSPSSNNSRGAGNAKNPPQERPQRMRWRFGASKPPLHPPRSVHSSTDRMKL